MHETLSKLSEHARDAPHIVERATEALREVFGTGDLTRIYFRHLPLGYLPLLGEAQVPYSAFKGDLWENDELIEEIILKYNHENPVGKYHHRTFRAMAVKLKVAQDHYLVVETSDLTRVFDDIDFMFIRSTALIIDNSLQDRLLKQALDAKASFLRGVQHSLRTSLNGILSASEMLLDDAAQSERLRDRRLSSSAGETPDFSESMASLSMAPSPSMSSSDSLLGIIDSSGRGLLTIINNLLNLDSTATAITPQIDTCNLADLEQEVMEAVVQGSARAKLGRVALILNNDLPDHIDTIMTDRTLLRQTLVAVVQNAMDATDTGSVIITTALSEDASILVFSVKDTGIGIKPVRPDLR